MKHILMILALFAAALTQAQTRPAVTSQQPVKDTSPMPRQVDPQIIVVELLVTENTAGGVSLSFDVGREQPTYFTDKEFAQQLIDMRKYSIASIPDGFSYLSGLGFRFVASYDLMLNGRNETHLVFERDNPRRREKPDQGAEPPARPNSRPGAAVPPTQKR